jgi:hypothetical protein
MVMYLKATLEHARHIKDHFTSGNWLTMEMNGLYTCGGLFPEFVDAPLWRKMAADTMYNQLAVQFLPDGAQIELSPGYHKVALDNSRSIADKGSLFGTTGELASEYASRLEKGYDYLLGIMTPDRNCPKLNDSWIVNMISAMGEAHTLFPSRKDFLWVATDGDSGSPPSFASAQFPYAGYCIMRSGWERDANYLSFDAGPLGYGHVHQDKLGVIAFAYGREVLFDDGGGEYEDSPYRKYATDTYGHNTILVDGMPQRRQTSDRWANVAKTPIDLRWESTDQYDFAAGKYTDGYSQENNLLAQHERRVLFVKPGIFVIADKLVPADTASHTYQARWHFNTTKTILDTAAHAVISADSGKPNLGVFALSGNTEIKETTGQTSPELLGWYVGRGDGAYIKATTVTHNKTAKGVQWFLTLILPLKAGNGLSGITVRPGFQNGSLTINTNNSAVWEIAADSANPDGILFTERSANGDIVRSIHGGEKPVAANHTFPVGKETLRLAQPSLIHFQMSSSEVCIKGYKPLSLIRMLALSGRVVRTVRADRNGFAIIPKEAVAEGIWLIDPLAK